MALDVDGTLLERDGSLPARRAEALAELAERVPVMLATGKTAPSVAPLLQQCRLQGPHAICNGAALLHADGTIEVLAELDPATADAITAGLERRGTAFAVYLGDGTICTPREDPRLTAITDLGEPAPRIGGPNGAALLKVLAVVDESQEAEFRDLGGDRSLRQRTGPSFLEWNAPGAAKGHAVAAVAARKGVPMDAVTAVGDAENDVTMLRRAGWGVAVRQSSPAAVAAADEHLEDDVADLLARLAAQCG